MVLCNGGDSDYRLGVSISGAKGAGSAGKFCARRLNCRFCMCAIAPTSIVPAPF
jgi:hypothetical protein